MDFCRVRYLEQSEKQATRPMYEAAFPEDSREFVDYYYSRKTKENDVIVMEGAGQDSSFHVVIHLNPHVLCINGNLRKIPYIVAVATEPCYRRQGKMGQVMGHALQDMWHRGIPFTFLLPADPVYYRGQGFVFFPCQDYVARGGICLAGGSVQGMVRAASLGASGIRGKFPARECRSADGKKWRRAGAEDAAKMALFSDSILEKKCAVYIRRDAQYYCRQLEELGAEHGGVLLSEEHGSVCGTLLYSMNSAGKAEVRELLLEEDVAREEAVTICRDALSGTGCMADDVTFTVSRMMVRLTSLDALVPLLRSETPILYEGKVTDSVIGANNGCFRIEVGSGGGKISRIEEADICRQSDIAEITKMLFGNTSVYLNEWV